MSVVREVRRQLGRTQDVNTELHDALREAERLADLFADVKPEPYIVPIERFAGLPVYEDKEHAKGK